MKITIDDKICLKHGLTPNEAMLALAIRTGEMEEDISNMVARGILVDKGEYLVTQRWSDVLDEILCDSQSSIEKSDEELLNLAQRMRECFPQGKMPGTPYYYRCNNSEVIKKLKKFFIQYGNYPDDDIVDACKRFVASFRGNYKYLPLVKYFISKLKDQEDEDGTIHKVEYSPLADYLENKEETVTDTSDWNTQTL